MKSVLSSNLLASMISKSMFAVLLNISNSARSSPHLLPPLVSIRFLNVNSVNLLSSLLLLILLLVTGSAFLTWGNFLTVCLMNFVSMVTVRLFTRSLRSGPYLALRILFLSSTLLVFTVYFVAVVIITSVKPVAPFMSGLKSIPEIIISSCNSPMVLLLILPLLWLFTAIRKTTPTVV